MGSGRECGVSLFGRERERRLDRVRGSVQKKEVGGRGRREGGIRRDKALKRARIQKSSHKEFADGAQRSSDRARRDGFDGSTTASVGHPQCVIGAGNDGDDNGYQVNYVWRKLQSKMALALEIASEKDRAATALATLRRE